MRAPGGSHRSEQDRAAARAKPSAVARADSGSCRTLMWHLRCSECNSFAGPYRTRLEARVAKKEIDALCVCPPMRVERCNGQGWHEHHIA